jgi:hypothetical protein
MQKKYVSPEKLIMEKSMVMSFFTWNMGMSFFGMPLYTLDICPENRDESNGNSILRLWLQFIPIFGALHSQLRKGHTRKKDFPMFLISIASPQKGITKKDISVITIQFF